MKLGVKYNLSLLKLDLLGQIFRKSQLEFKKILKSENLLKLESKDSNVKSEKEVKIILKELLLLKGKSLKKHPPSVLMNEKSPLLKLSIKNWKGPSMASPKLLIDIIIDAMKLLMMKMNSKMKDLFLFFIVQLS